MLGSGGCPRHRPMSAGALGLTAPADVTVADSTGTTSQAPVPRPRSAQEPLGRLQLSEKPSQPSCHTYVSPKQCLVLMPGCE